MNEFFDWSEIRAELHDGDDEALTVERSRTEAWIDMYRREEETGPGGREPAVGGPPAG